MGALTPYATNKLVNHVFKNSYTPVPYIYIAFYTAHPYFSNNSMEIDYPSYQRKQIIFNKTDSRKITHTLPIIFPRYDGTDIKHITHWGILDDCLDGNLLAYGSIVTNQGTKPGSPLRLSPLSIYIRFDPGIISNFLASRLLNHMFANHIYTQPDGIYVSIATKKLNDWTTCTTMEELTNANGVKREVVKKWIINGSTANNAKRIQFNPTLPEAKNIEAAVICDSSKKGNILFYDNEVKKEISTIPIINKILQKIRLPLPSYYEYKKHALELSF